MKSKVVPGRVETVASGINLSSLRDIRSLDFLKLSVRPEFFSSNLLIKDDFPEFAAPIT